MGLRPFRDLLPALPRGPDGNDSAALRFTGCEEEGTRRFMPDNSDELRKTAAECLALARTTADPKTHLGLITIAQALLTSAEHGGGKSAQQQQQQQPQTGEDGPPTFRRR